MSFNVPFNTQLTARMLNTFQQVDLSKNFYFSSVHIFHNHTIPMLTRISVLSLPTDAPDTRTTSPTLSKPTSLSLDQTEHGTLGSCGTITSCRLRLHWKNRKGGVDGFYRSFMVSSIKRVSYLGL